MKLGSLRSLLDNLITTLSHSLNSKSRKYASIPLWCSDSPPTLRRQFSVRSNTWQLCHVAVVSFIRLVLGTSSAPQRAAALAQIAAFWSSTAHAEHRGGAEVSAYGGFVVCIIIVKQGSVQMRDKLDSFGIYY